MRQSRRSFCCRAGRAAVLLALLFFGPAEATPDQAVRSFFNAVRARDYPKAYSFFATALQREIPLSRFRDGADNVLAFKLLEQKLLDREPNLVKYKVRARLRIRYEGRLYDADYAGQADVVLDQGTWRVLSVDLKAVSQKDLGPFRYR